MAADKTSKSQEKRKVILLFFFTFKPNYFVFDIGRGVAVLNLLIDKSHFNSWTQINHGITDN